MSRAKLPPVPREKRPPRVEHALWTFHGYGQVTLEEGEAPQTGDVYSCDRCGVLRVWVRVELDPGFRYGPVRHVALYGIDEQSLVRMHAAPSCEVLTMPSRPLDEDDDDNAAAPEAA